MSKFIGKRIGNYQLTRLLGRGGFADVYLGEHIHLKMDAALKLIYGDLDSCAVEKFIKEAQVIADLRHPHIVRILEFGFEHQQPFFVMDYAQNGTLREQHPCNSCVDLPTIISYVKQVASALAYIHANKFIHRDIKPENMLLDKDGNVLLSDFGIVAVAHTTASMEPRQGGGTVYYMAPEQIRGQPRPASDQYSLAIVVYEWITGTRPFSGSSYAEVVMRHLSEPPLSLREKVHTLSPQVEQVVLKALSKDLQQRFPTIQDFSTALEEAYLLSMSNGSGMVLGPAIPPKTPFIPDPAFGSEGGSSDFSRGPEKLAPIIEPSSQEPIQEPDRAEPIIEPSSQEPIQESGRAEPIIKQPSQEPIQVPAFTDTPPQKVTTGSLLERFSHKKTLVLIILGLVICLVSSGTWLFLVRTPYADPGYISQLKEGNMLTSTYSAIPLLDTQVTQTSAAQLTPTAQPTLTAQSIPTAQPVQPTPTAQPTAIVDNWSQIYAKAPNLRLVTENSQKFDGDTSRAYPDDATYMHRYIVWHLQGMNHFQAIVYFYYDATKNHFNVYTSLNGKEDWIKQNPTISEPSSGNWQQSKYTLSNVSNANFVKLEWNNIYGQEWPPQVSSVIVSS
jgi:serine/threonine protein kinase